MKREQTDNSSFDLFLDTICNTFGGIVFLAILLAIMIQTRAIVKTPDGSNQQPPTPDEIRELITQLDSLSAQHASLAQALKDVPASSVSEKNLEAHQLAAQLDQLTEELVDAATQQTSKTRRLAERLAENARLEEENNRVPAELQAVQDQMAQARTALRTTVADQQQTLQLPRVRASNSASVLLLLQSQRVYLAMEPGLYGGDFNSTHVDAVSTLDGGTELTPVAGAGWPTTTASGQARIDQAIDAAAARRNIITIAAWPDSYEQFAEVKAKIVSAGVGYQLWPQQDQEPLVLYRGGGRSTVQ